jgi:hypothetical protein
MGHIQRFDWTWSRFNPRIEQADLVALRILLLEITMNVRSLAIALLVFTSAGFAAEPQDRKASTRAFVEEKVAVWQKRLKLDEWNIAVMMVRKDALKPDTLGGIKWDKKKRSATLWTLDPADYTVSDEDMRKDLEFTVVHELIHLELSSLPKSEASRRTEERAVNQLAEALLALQRGKN